MPGFFERSKDKPAKGPATDRPKQERRTHSDYVKDESSHRPSLFTSRTWYTSSNGESSPKPPKPKKNHGRVRSFFSNSDSSDDGDGLEFQCQGEVSKNHVGDGGSSSKDSASLKPVTHRVSTRSPSTVKSKIPSSRSTSQHSPAPRKKTSSDALPTKSPYTKLSATSHTNPRSRRDVYDPRDQIEDSGTVSDPEYYSGRDGRNSSRNRMKVKPPNDGVNFHNGDRNGKTKPNHHPPGALTDRSYHQDKEERNPSHDKNDGYNFSRNGNKPTSRRRENPDSSASKTAGNRGKIGYVPRVPHDDHEPHSYEVQDYRKFNSVNLNRQYRARV